VPTKGFLKNTRYIMKTAKKTAAAAPSLKEATATAAAAAAAPKSAKERKAEFQATAAAAAALVTAAIPTEAAEIEAALDWDGARKRGERQIAPEAHPLLLLAMGGVKEKQWELKGGSTAHQFKGAVTPITGAVTEREKALAAGVNRALAPFVGFGLRVIRFTGKRGVSYFAVLTVAGR
jgi:hypothetical protein